MAGAVHYPLIVLTAEQSVRFYDAFETGFLRLPPCPDIAAFLSGEGVRLPLPAEGSEKKVYALSRASVLSVLKSPLQEGSQYHAKWSMVQMVQTGELKFAICRLAEAFDPKDLRRLQVIAYAHERKSGVDLEFFLSGLPLVVRRLRLIVEAVVASVYLFHLKGKVHGDLKPENTIYDEETEVAHLVDYDYVQVQEAGTVIRDCSRTPAYAAFEVVLHGKISAASDVFALGRMIQYILDRDRGTDSSIFAKTNPSLPREDSMGRFPFNYAALREWCSNKEASLEGLSPEENQLLKRMLAKRPEDRPTMDLICQTLAPTRYYSDPLKAAREASKAYAKPSSTPLEAVGVLQAQCLEALKSGEFSVTIPCFQVINYNVTTPASACEA